MRDTLIHECFELIDGELCWSPSRPRTHFKSDIGYSRYLRSFAGKPIKQNVFLFGVAYKRHQVINAYYDKNDFKLVRRDCIESRADPHYVDFKGYNGELHKKYMWRPTHQQKELVHGYA